MSEKTTLKPLAVAMGAAFVTSLAGTGIANAADNPFAMSDLSSGYMVAESEAKGKEGNCGGKMKSGEMMEPGEGMGGEMRKAHEGNCGGKMKSGEMMKPGEGMGGGMKEGMDKGMKEGMGMGSGMEEGMGSGMEEGMDSGMEEGTGSDMKEPE